MKPLVIISEALAAEHLVVALAVAGGAALVRRVEVGTARVLSARHDACRHDLVPGTQLAAAAVSRRPRE